MRGRPRHRGGPGGTDEAAAGQDVRYVEKQLGAMIAFVTEHAGRPLDPERLREAVLNSNRAREEKLKLYDLLKAVPSPANPQILRDFGYVGPMFDGTASAIAVCDAFQREFRDAMRAGAPGVPGEALRLLWIQNRIQFRSSAKKALLTRYRANVFDDMNDVFWDPIDPDDPLPGFARRMIRYPLGFNSERRIELLARQVREFRIDGVINPCNWGCRQLMAQRGLIAARLREQGIPVLNLEVDCVDARNVAEGPVSTRLEAFLETLVDRKRHPARS